MKPISRMRHSDRPWQGLYSRHGTEVSLHNIPDHSGAHRQTYDAPRDSHVPLFIHAPITHASSFCSWIFNPAITGRDNEVLVECFNESERQEFDNPVRIFESFIEPRKPSVNSTYQEQRQQIAITKRRLYIPIRARCFRNYGTLENSNFVDEVLAQ